MGALEAEEVLLSADQDGWALIDRPMTDFRSQLMASGTFQERRMSVIEDSHLLRPVDRAIARRRTLSALVGFEAQPLHTDGAHKINPPLYICLQAQDITPTATEVMRIDSDEVIALGRRTIFKVNNGARTFYRAAHGDLGWQFDPGCMTPANPAARQFIDILADLRCQTKWIEWDSPSKLLVINNRRALHARSAVVPGDLSRSIARLSITART